MWHYVQYGSLFISAALVHQIELIGQGCLMIKVDLINTISQDLQNVRI